MSYLVHILVMLSIYEILVVSLNITVGYGGMLSLCHTAFYGLGYWYTWQVSILGLGPVWMSGNETTSNPSASSFRFSESFCLRGLVRSKRI